MILDKTVKVKTASRSIKYYRDLGYECGKNTEIEVKVEDLPKGSRVCLNVACDYCNKKLIKPYDQYNKSLKNQGKFACGNCKTIKAHNTNLEKYGVISPMMLDEYKEKAKNTSLEKYGKEYYTQTEECREKTEKTSYERYGAKTSLLNDDVQEKIKDTLLDRYGVDHPWKSEEILSKVKNTIYQKYGVENVSCSDEIKEKKKKTFLKHYGVEYPFQSEELYSHMGDVLQERYGARNCMQSKEIRQKAENTMLEKYGFKNPNQVPEIREKINKTNIERYGGISPICSEDVKLKCRESMYKNSTVSTSTQQIEIYNIIKSEYPQTELNYPIGKKFSGDIVIDNIDFEVDYGGHNLSVKLGEITQDEFDKKEMIRDKIVKSCGYKVIRLIADNTRKIPSDEILLKILEQSKEYFNTTNHTWVDYNIDTSLMRNAENKEGVFFDFGELRKIKKTG